MNLEFFDQTFYDEINRKVATGKATEEEIRSYSNYIRPSNFYENYNCSTDFLREFKDSLDWQQVCMWTCLPEDFVWEMEDYIYFNELLFNHPNDYSEEFYRKYFTSYFDKNSYKEIHKHLFKSFPKQFYMKQIQSVGQVLENGLALTGMTRLELLYKYELKENIKNWAPRLNFINAKYCKRK